jgi:hypothetical protein
VDNTDAYLHPSDLQLTQRPRSRSVDAATGEKREGTPMQLRKRWCGALGAGLMAALLLAACGGDAEPPAADASPTAPALVTPTATATPTPTPTPSVTSPATLNAYRYAILLRLSGAALEQGQAPPGLDLEDATFEITLDGEVVNPDRHRTLVKASLGFIELGLERVQIGGQVWTREAEGEWRQVTAGANDLLGGDFDVNPNTLFGADAESVASLGLQLDQLPSTVEMVNDISARRYDFTAEDFRRVFSASPDLLPLEDGENETTATLWVAEDSGVPVRLLLTARSADGEPAFELELNLRDLEDASISIEPPA